MLSRIEADEHFWIPLRDGRRLAAKIWLPKDEAKIPSPAILEYLPYRKRDATAPRDATTYPAFAEAGYAGVRVDIAGTGESDAIFDDEYSERELRDCEAVIEWIASQSWCDGNVGIIGISWGGFNGLQMAFRRPRALKAVVSACSCVDRYKDDTHFMDGCLLTDNFGWSAQMSAYLARPPDPELRDDWREQWIERIEKLPFLAAIWQSHPLRDEYWRRGSVCEDWSAIQVPVLAIGGWADAYLNAPCQLAARLDAPAKALIGPWEHKYPHIASINPADFHGEVIGWFDRWLKGEENGVETLPAYRAFMQEHDDPSPEYAPRKGRWIAEEKWPSPNIVERVFLLGEGGLTQEASAAGLGASRSAQAEPTPCPSESASPESAPDSSGSSPPGSSESGADESASGKPGSDSSCADESGPDESASPPGADSSSANESAERVVATPLLVGRASAYWCPGMRIDNELAADQAEDDALSACFDSPALDGDLEILGRPALEILFAADKPAAQLCARLCDVSPEGASRRITYRAFNLAHHGGSESVEPLEPGRFHRATILLNECAHRLRKGHRLRLALSTSYWPLIWPSPEAAAVTLRLASCRLILPQRRVKGAEIDPKAPGPPRDFPRYAGESLRSPRNCVGERTGEAGERIRESCDDFGMMRDPDHGLESASCVRQLYAIHPDDPLSARHEIEWRFEFRRGDWAVSVDTRSRMTCDGENFHLERLATTRESDGETRTRRWRETIPRGLL